MNTPIENTLEDRVTELEEVCDIILSSLDVIVEILTHLTNE